MIPTIRDALLPASEQIKIIWEAIAVCVLVIEISLICGIIGG